MKIKIMNPIEKGPGRCGAAFVALALLVPFMAFGLTSCDQNDDVEDESEGFEVGEDDEIEETE
jgi:hypothetical protein